MENWYERSCHYSLLKIHMKEVAKFYSEDKFLSKCSYTFALKVTQWSFVLNLIYESWNWLGNVLSDLIWVNLNLKWKIDNKMYF